MPPIDLFNQSEPLWTRSVHEKERSPHGQEYLNRNRGRLGGQNKRVLEALMEGLELDASIVRKWEPEIWHLHSRIADLTSVKKFGFHISNKPHPTKNLTVYFMDAEQKEYNKILMQSLAQERK